LIECKTAQRRLFPHRDDGVNRLIKKKKKKIARPVFRGIPYSNNGQRQRQQKKMEGWKEVARTGGKAQTIASTLATIEKVVFSIDIWPES
jgi:hypothetical protein